MDKKLQKEILKIFIQKGDNLIKEDDIINTINQLRFNEYSVKNTIPSLGKLKHQINLLIDDKSLIKEIDANLSRPNYYRITEWGELKAKGGFDKIWHWLIYKNHNLISFIAIILSLLAIIIPMIKINRFNIDKIQIINSKN